MPNRTPGCQTQAGDGGWLRFGTPRARAPRTRGLAGRWARGEQSERAPWPPAVDQGRGRSD
eukprot:12016612-Alexandrium_andersonii.AAC.1